jgi:hypothetical protein
MFGRRVTALVLVACLPGAAGAGTVEERLEALEREQAEMKDQLEEKDRKIRDLELMVSDQAAAAAAAPTGGEDQPSPKEIEAEEIAAEPTWGDMDPGKGFKVAKTPYGDLSISAYALVRYINQLPPNQNFRDHLGREHEVDTRQDVNLHRVLIHFLGWAYDPRLRYALSVWTVNATEQIRLVGNLSYTFNEQLRISGGIGGMPGTRSLLGSHPYWLAHDRVMADEYFRPGFTAGLWADGRIAGDLYYKFMLGNNISQLGVSATELTRSMSPSMSLWWMPTTGEFGPQGGFGDWEHHEQLATRFGISGTFSREDRAAQTSQSGPDATQIRLGDSLFLFETGALADGVTVRRADYGLLAADAGFKYKGFFLQIEAYRRWLADFDANGPLPVKDIVDNGFYVQGAFFPIERKLELYGATSWVFADEDAGFDTSQEFLVGANWYPFDTRNARINMQSIFVQDSPVSSTFGFYTGGLDGVVLSLGASVYF